MLDKHPCLYVFLAWLAGIPLRVAGLAGDILALALVGDAIFTLGVLLAICVFIRRRTAARKQPLAYCSQCGNPCYSQEEIDEHALSHR